tara:strand:- start:6140 stop:7951 length:1812 start_codon:yes stop_codon:yes gene_type:complete
MAVYRSDQAQLTFASEFGGQGADAEMIEATVSGSTALLAAAVNAGSKTITIDTIATASLVVGDFIRIGTVAGTASATVNEHEVRRIEALTGTQQVGTSPGNVITVLLDRPTAFYHANNEEVKEATAIGGDATRNDKAKYITFIPGVYETLDTPDPEMSIEGKRFLSTQSKRNFSVAYAGQQTLVGSVADFVLLNGWPLRFPIGKVVTTPSALEGSTILLNGATKKGDVYISADGANVSNLAVGDYINIDDGSSTLSEVRRIIAEPASDTFKLDYPLQFDHDDDVSIDEVSTSAYYTHVITETNDLDTVSWHVHMKDSSETAAKDFNRRYLGGMIGTSTISAEEGGMVMMSWDSVNFLNMVHNQQEQTTVGTNLYNGASIQANMPRYALMQQIDSDDINMGSQAVGSGNDGSGYPSTSPYYFSQGTIKYFGVEFARIRNFSISISNNEEPRYYLSRQGARSRGPSEIVEGARDYTMSATVVLPDADFDANAAYNVSNLQTGATELFKQLLLEGNYGGSTQATAMTGMTATLQFTRGTNDHIYIDIPTSSTAGTPTAGSNALNSQGMFINTAPHNITTDNPLQVDIDCIFRSLKITIQDSVPVYP